MKRYLAVSFSEKDIAKSLGAKWDPQKKMWYAPHDQKDLLDRWPLNTRPIEEFVGEDRNFGGGELFVDLVPQSCWFTNARKCIHPCDWDRVRRYVYERAGHACECCGAEASLEAHERWYYDKVEKIQKLMRLVALCRSCHEATHMGLAQVNGRAEVARQHLMKVKGMGEQEARQHIEKAFEIWEARNAFDWYLDLSMITDSGIKLVHEFGASSRGDEANRPLVQVRTIPGGEAKAYVERIRNHPSTVYHARLEPSFVDSKSDSKSILKIVFYHVRNFFLKRSILRSLIVVTLIFFMLYFINT